MDFCHCPVNNSVLFLIVCQNPLCCCLVAKLSLTLWPHELQYTRLPCLSLSPGVCWNSCPLNQWYHPTNSSSIHPLLLSSVFPSVRVFSNESALSIRWPKYWSFIFSISLSNEYSGFISFRIDWFDLAVQGIFQSLLQYHNFKASILQYSTYLMVQLSH